MIHKQIIQTVLEVFRQSGEIGTAALERSIDYLCNLNSSSPRTVIQTVKGES